MPVSPSSEGQMTAMAATTVMTAQTVTTTATTVTTVTTVTTAQTAMTVPMLEVCNHLPKATLFILTYCTDVRELLTRCNMSTTAYNSAILSSFPTPTGGPGGPGGPIVVTSGTAVLTLPPPPPTGGPNGNGQNGGNGQGGNGQGGNNNRPLAVAQGGAPAQTATVGAALALGAFGMVMALL